MKGYKAFNMDMTCRGFQYEIGRTYRTDEEIRLCSCGFHFCKTITDCFDFYDKRNCRVCEIEASGDIIHGDDKCCCSEITIGKEIMGIELNRIIYGDGYGDAYAYGKNIQKILSFKEI